VQALLQAAGVNPLTGESLDIAPESGVIESPITGELINIHTGQPTTLSQEEWGARLLGGLARSLPQVRLAEAISLQGRPVYPESIPFLRPRPIAVSPEGTSDVSLEGIAREMFGVRPDDFDLEEYQRFSRKETKAARSVYKSKMREKRRREKKYY
jgi:hypothetical protein